MTFQVAKVDKALGSVSNIVANGNKVVLYARGSYIGNVWSGDGVWFREDKGPYVLDMMVAPQTSPLAQDLPGRVSKW